MQEIRILHLEEDPLFGDAVTGRLLAPAESRDRDLSFTIRRVTSFAAFKRALEEGKFELLLSDHDVVDSTGLAVLDFCRLQYPALPFIFLSGKISSDLAFDSMAHGATDYIPKTELPRLVPTVLRALNIFLEANALREAQARIRRDQANLRALIENTSDAVWSMDLNFRILACNSGASQLSVKMCGHPMEAGGDFLQYLPEASHALWLSAAARVRNREQFRAEHRLACVGKNYVFAMSFNPIFQNGVVFGMAVFGQDLTPAELAPQIPAIREASFPTRTLVVEDNQINQFILRSFLEKFGYASDLACNGLEALEAFRKSPYELIFMDCRMPMMDGFAAARGIRELEAATGDHAWIVAVTADVTPGIQERCHQAGMNDYLAKPLPMSLLKAALDRAASRRSLRS